MTIQRPLTSGDCELVSDEGAEASTVSRKTMGKTATPGEAVLYRKKTTKKNSIKKNASRDSTWCNNEGATRKESMPYSRRETKWKTVPRPTAGSMMRVKTGRPPHRDSTAYTSPNPYRLRATRNQNRGIEQ